MLLALISGYLAWQNRSSEKVITGFLSILLVGSATTLASTLFIMKNDVQEMEVIKSYIFNKVSKELLIDYLKPYFDPVSGFDHRIDIPFLVRAAIDNDPDAQMVLDENGDSKTLQKGLDIYNRVLIAEIIETLCRNCNWLAKSTRQKGLGGVSIITYERPPKNARYSTITIQDFEKFFPDSALFSSHVFEHFNFF